MARSSGQGLASSRGNGLSPSCNTSRRALVPARSVGLRQSPHCDVSVAANTSGASTSSFPTEALPNQRQHPDVSCRAVLVAECEVETTSPGLRIGGSQGTSTSPKQLPTDNVDVAIIGADVAGLATALAVAKAQPGARVMMYDSASEPPFANDGGALLAVNGQRALRAIDSPVYQRLASELSTSVHESLWFDMEGDLVRRSPLGQPSAASSSGASSSSGPSSRRRSSMRRRVSPAAGGARAAPAEPDPAAPPFVVGIHELREALADALPAEVQIFGRHHVRSIEPLPGGGALISFAASAGGPAVRAVRTKMLVGADGPSSAVKRLQFDPAPEASQTQPSGRIVWRGRFTLRQRDPDFARLRNFTTATRTWVDLRATPGSERVATLAPAGPNTYVWTASCPTAMLASRGLKESGGASTYWRCMAMFEDFPQDFFASLRATADNAVVELPSSRPPPAAAAAGLAAPWRWAAGAAGLVGDAVVALPADDASSTAVNLALEDAAVLGECVAAYGMGQRAMAEYARLRGPRVSAILALPPSAPERLRLRDAPFLLAGPAPAPSTAVAQASPAAPALEPQVASSPALSPPAEKPQQGLEAAVASAVDAAAVASTAVAPAATLEQVLVQAATVAAAAAQPPYNPGALPNLGRPSGGATRSMSPGSSSAAAAAAAAAPSSLLFSRPSGARRLGPLLPAVALASVAGLIADRMVAAAAASGSVGPAPATTSTTAAARAASVVELASPSAGSLALPAAPPAPAEPYAAGSSPAGVWEALLRPAGARDASTDPPAAGTSQQQQGPAADGPGVSPRGYCVLETPPAVWNALLAVPEAPYGKLALRPYDAAESPALVWASLLQSQPPPRVAAVPAAAPPATTTNSSAAAAAAKASPAPVAATALLPKPVPKPAKATGNASGPSPEAGAAPASATAVHPDLAAAAAAAAPEVLAQPQSQAQTPPPSPGNGRSRRSHRGHHSSSSSSPTSSSTTAGERKGGGAKGGKPNRRGAANAARNAAAKAAKAAAKMTVSLSAAAALGGVISSAGAGHVDVATALHVHGTVAQFWDDLNSLTLSSMSSIDMS